MALKHLLLHLSDGRDGRSHVEVAVRLAKAHDAYLTGLYVRPGYAARYAPTSASPAFADQLRRMAEMENERLHKDETDIIDRFTEAAGAAGVPAGHLVETGADGNGAVSHLVRHGRAADLIVLGKPYGDDSGMPHDVLFAAGVPVIMVPETCPDGVGRRIVIAWNGGREAARAVRDALPILERAEKVDVLCVNQRVEGSNIRPGSDLAEHLAHHGIKASVDSSSPGKVSVADAIIARITDVRADLLVMGAWGHSRLREMVLGGVTRRILENAPVPVLMSH
jgi:nucleotide-binding universal stress UspA family protein